MQNISETAAKTEAVVTTGIRAEGAGIGTLGYWVLALAFVLQLYYDFSGYSDMAIGLGKILGFTFPENFRYPFISKSISEFWRRWHMTLGGWFRDYLYIPLGGNRVSVLRWCFNMFVVWLLSGLWHGAGWNLPSSSALPPFVCVQYTLFRSLLRNSKGCTPFQLMLSPASTRNRWRMGRGKHAVFDLICIPFYGKIIVLWYENFKYLR